MKRIVPLVLGLGLSFSAFAAEPAATTPPAAPKTAKAHTTKKTVKKTVKAETTKPTKAADAQ
jgi:hypothetical protein